MEMVTYRYGGHSMSDPGTTYRTREEINQMRSKRDAINLIKDRILSNGLATEAEIKAIDKSVRAEMDQAVEEATKAAEPDMSTLYADIYVKGSEPPTVRGVTPMDVHHYWDVAWIQLDAFFCDFCYV